MRALARHHIHPLVEEANVITREVFGNSDLHLECRWVLGGLKESSATEIDANRLGAGDPYPHRRAGLPKCRWRSEQTASFTEDAPEIVICCLEKPSPLARFQQTVNTVQHGLRDPTAPPSSQDLADKRWMLGRAKHPLAHAMGLDEHMTIRGHGHLLSIFSLEDFLRLEVREQVKQVKNELSLLKKRLSCI